MTDSDSLPSDTQRTLEHTRTYYATRAADHHEIAQKSRRSAWMNVAGGLGIVCMVGFTEYAGHQAIERFKTIDPARPSRDLLVKGAETCLKQDWLKGTARAVIDQQTPVPAVPAQEIQACARQEAINLAQKKRGDLVFPLVLSVGFGILGLGLGGTFARDAHRKFKNAADDKKEADRCSERAKDCQNQLNTLKTADDYATQYASGFVRPIRIDG